MSRIRANQITNQSADGAPTVQNGLVISGVTTSTTFSGSGASLTNLPAAQLTGTLPSIDGSNLTGITQTAINNNADNRVITGSGTANTLEGEATLTFTNSGSAGQLNLKRSTSTDQEAIFYYGSSNLEIETREATGIKLKTNKSDKVIIFSDGRVSLGGNLSSYTSSNMSSAGDDLVIAPPAGNNGGITIVNSGSNDIGNIFFANGTGETAIGRIQYEHQSNALSFTANSGERLRIKSDGVLLLPTTGKLSVGVTNPTGRFSVGPANGSRVIEIEEYGVIRGYDRNSSAWAQIDFEASSYSFDCGGTERLNINSSGQVTQSAQPSFAAYRNQDGYGLNNEVFPFNVTRHNTGSHFNTGNHRFTAPVAGRYLFTFYSILNTQINSGVYSFRVNNSTSYGHNVHFTTVNSSWDHVSTSQIMNLNANDYVTMWSNSNINWHGNGWQIFCGELLS